MGSPASRLRSLVARCSTTKDAALIAVASLISALLYLPFAGEPLFGNEAVYSTVALGLLDGQLPYRDLFDNKPPLLYGWFSLSFLLFGEEAYAPRRPLPRLSVRGCRIGGAGAPSDPRPAATVLQRLEPVRP